MMHHFPIADKKFHTYVKYAIKFLSAEYTWNKDYVWRPNGSIRFCDGCSSSLGELFVTNDLAIILKLKFQL